MLQMLIDLSVMLKLRCMHLRGDSEHGVIGVFSLDGGWRSQIAFDLLLLLEDV